jgi:16S rRNA (cytosine1402-N4)-methyltransferase
VTLKQKVNKNMSKDHQKHIPVLLDATLDLVQAQKGETLLDATAGYGGHSAAILERTLQDSGSVLVDRDEHAVKELQKTFKGRPVQIIHETFMDAARVLAEEGEQFDIIVADLGVSSPHLDNSTRGFSFKTEATLDMRMDPSQALTAETIVNEYSEDELIRILREYGEEPKARRIAKAIIEARPIQTTTELASVVERAVRAKWQKAHPATKTFQALRIAVNDELGQLRAALPLWVSLLKPGGRLAVISFHSLEDRIVKQFLSARGGDRYDADLQILTKKPVTAAKDELVFNPRARSAKLRVAVKIKKERVQHANPGKK